MVGAPSSPTEMLGQFADGHDFEEDMSKDPLPAVGDDPLTGGGDDALEGVEEAVLSGVDDVDHGGRNSFLRIWLSIELRPAKVKRKMDINSDFSLTCAEN